MAEQGCSNWQLEAHCIWRISSVVCSCEDFIKEKKLPFALWEHEATKGDHEIEKPIRLFFTDFCYYWEDDNFSPFVYIPVHTDQYSSKGFSALQLFNVPVVFTLTLEQTWQAAPAKAENQQCGGGAI